MTTLISSDKTPFEYVDPTDGNQLHRVSSTDRYVYSLERDLYDVRFVAADHAGVVKYTKKLSPNSMYRFPGMKSWLACMSAEPFTV